LNRIALGLVKKMVLADFLATLVEPVFAGPAEYTGYHCLIAAYGYAFQVFFDFSGYCDIALGAAALLGYRLPENFDAPYLSRNPSEFWRRWHITLSNWFRDYVFLKVCFVVSRRLGGERFFGLRSDHVVYTVGTMVVMTLCGLWHGANWTFVVWGAVQGLLLVGHRLWSGGRVIAADRARSYRLSLRAVLLFPVLSVGYIFFRATSLSSAGQMLANIARIPAGLRAGEVSIREIVVLLLAPPILLLAYSWAVQLWRRCESFAPRNWMQDLAYGGALALTLVLLSAFSSPPARFIYFQF